MAEKCEERGEAREGVRSKEVAALCGVSLRRRASSLSRQALEELEAPYLPISPHISPYLPISQALEELEAEPVPEGCCREVFVLPAAAWGRVKGQGNMGLQRLRERAGCKVVAHLRPPDRFPQCKVRRCSPAAAGRARRLFTARAVNRRCYSSGRGRRLMAQSGCCAKRSAVTRGRET